MEELAEFYLRTSGIETIIILTLLALSVAYALYSAANLETDTPSERTQQTEFQRGGVLKYVIGRREVRPAFMYEGNSWWENIRIDNNNKRVEYFSSAVHGIALGPVRTLFLIKYKGEVIFQGPITSDSHPSGTEIDIGVGVFRIYWGENVVTQDPCLITPEFLNTTMSHPFTMKIFWKFFSLGPVRNWGELVYDVELVPNFSTLSNSDAFFDGVIDYIPDPDNPPNDVVNTFFNDVPSGGFSGPLSPGDWYFEVYNTSFFSISRHKNSGRFTIEGNPGLPDGDYDILLVEPPVAFIVGGVPGYTVRLYPNTTLPSGNSTGPAAGTIKPYGDAEGSGVNPAHLISQILFAPWPHGQGKEEKWYDIQSLESLGQLMQAEGLGCSIEIGKGDTYLSVMNVILQNISCALPVDTLSEGRLRFVPLRDGDTIFPIPDGIIVDTNIESEFVGGPLPVNRTSFTFKRRNRNWTPDTIHSHSNADTILHGGMKTRKSDLRIFHDVTTASKTARRRQAEDLSGSETFRVEVHKQGRMFYPGLLIAIPDTPKALRIVEVRMSEKEGTTFLDCTQNSIAVPQDLFVKEDSNPGGGPKLDIFPPAPDIACIILELPFLALIDTSQTVLMVPRIRAHEQISQADIVFSTDNNDFSIFAPRTPLLQTGGVSTAVLDSSDLDNPTIAVSILGPDFGILPDLTADDVAYFDGGIWVVAGKEIMFARRVANLGGGAGNIQGLLRGQFGTVVETHPIGTVFFAFEPSEILTIAVEEFQDLTIPTIWVKTLPLVGQNSVGLDDAPTHSLTFERRGVGPVPITNLFVDEESSNTFESGDDVPFTWMYNTPFGDRSGGAGLGGYGNAVNDTNTPFGIFQITIKTLALVVKGEFSSTINEFLYTNAQMVSDFGFEPSSFIIEIVNTANEFDSAPVSITVTRI